jgi:beta-lactamase class C
MTSTLASRFGIIAALFLCTTGASAADTPHAQQTPDTPRTAEHDRLARVVDDAIRPVMAQHHVPGMAVAVTVRGKSYVFNYGLASKAEAKPVTQHTMFELGSVSKTFTATLAAYAAQRGALSFADKASQYLPGLAGSSFDGITLLDLGTYTAGGLPLQFPDAVATPAQMLAYFRDWKPEFAPGTHRRYSNPSIGLFGYLSARSMGEPFDDLMEHRIFPGLGLKHTFIRVPQARMGDYAYGYKDDKPIRVNPGMFDSEAYGVKTTAADLIRFVEANIDGSRLDPLLQGAIAGTHTGYFRVGPMTQGLGWEMYAWPTSLDDLLVGNAAGMVQEASEAARLTPPQAPRADVLINKTGSTNGFGSYVVFVPARQIGVVMLANRNLPIPDRVRAAYRILTALDAQ